MIKKLYLIGIGPGDPRYLTLEAKALLERLELFLIPEKRGPKEGLTQKRLEIIKSVRGDRPFQCLFLPFPEREKGINYRDKVREWRRTKAEILKKALLREETEEAGFLIWGDPTLYDGHIDILREIEKELNLSWEVVPGLSSFQVLGARLKVSLTDLSSPLTFHTPRTLRKLKELEHPVIVFLDNYETFSLFKGHPYQIYWGAYVGQKDEVYIEGPLEEVVSDIKETRRLLKAQKGYLMEIYLVRPGEERDA